MKASLLPALASLTAPLAKIVFRCAALPASQNSPPCPRGAVGLWQEPSVTQATYFVGLDVAVKQTAVCICDQDYNIITETKVDTDPEVIALFLYDHNLPFERVGLEAGPMSQWLYAGLCKAGLPTICVETKHARDFIRSQINKNDRNDARGLARMMMSGIYKPVHVKTIESQRTRVLLSARKALQQKMIDIEISIRGLLRNFGLRVGVTTKASYEGRIRDLVENEPALQVAIGPMLVARRALREQFNVLHKSILAIVRKDAVCRRFMTTPGVGPLVALHFKTGVDIPERFRTSKSVGAHLGLTPRQYQSGDTDVMGRISKCGDPDVRTALVEAAMCIIARGSRHSSLKSWGIKLAKKRGMHKAACAVARRLAAILHRMWLDGTEFRWSEEVTEYA